MRVKKTVFKLRKKFDKLKEHKFFDTFAWWTIRGILVGIGAILAFIIVCFLLIRAIEHWPEIFAFIAGGIIFLVIGIVAIFIACIALTVLFIIGMTVLSWFGKV